MKWSDGLGEQIGLGEAETDKVLHYSPNPNPKYKYTKRTKNEDICKINNAFLIDRSQYEGYSYHRKIVKCIYSE